MKNFTDTYINALNKERSLEPLEIIKIKYALVVLKNDLVKFLILGLLFFCFGYFKAFLITFLLILPVRLSTGGLHFNSNVKCFTASFIYFFLSVIILPQIYLSHNFYNIILILSVAAIIALPLMPSSKRPIISRKKYLQNKCFSIIYLLIYFVLFYYILSGSYIVQCGVWALSLQALQILVIYLSNLQRRNQNV